MDCLLQMDDAALILETSLSRSIFILRIMVADVRWPLFGCNVYFFGNYTKSIVTNQ